MRRWAVESYRLIFTLLALAGFLSVASAPAGAAAEAKSDSTIAAAYEAAGKAMIPGPGAAKITDQAALTLTAEDAFIPMPEAQRLLQAIGKPYRPDVTGLVVPRNGSGKWMVIVGFQKLGYFAPDTLAKLSKDEIYDEIRRGLRRGNERRKTEGHARLDLANFVEPPAYDRAHDSLFMASSILTYGEGDAVAEGTSMDAYIFGREGVLTLSLPTHAGGYANLRHHMEKLYSSAAFVPGKRTADVDPADKRAEYPLELLFGSRTAEDIAKDKAAADNRRRQYELIEEEQRRADRDFQLYLIAGAASLLLASMTMFAFHRATAA